MAFFTPHHGYFADGFDSGVSEFRSMVKALHDAGIEVILDVVYNHTAEGEETGHTYSFRGIDNGTYYMLEPDMNHYRDDTGTGNVLRSAGSGLRAWLSCADASAPGSGGPTAPNSKLIGASPPLMRVACSTTNESLPMSRTTRPTDGESREADTV